MKHVGEIEYEAELAAAEERGRRSAETERDELRAALRDAAAALALGANELIRRLNEKREKMSTTEAVNDEVTEAVVRAWGDAKAALAPRDSAPVCDNCKRAAKAKDGRTDRGIPIGPCYCDTLREVRK